MRSPGPATVPSVLKLLAHDVRWQLVEHLARSDRRVGELVGLVGERQNLVSYHLRLLRDAELVAERRSSRDARDVYYALDKERLRTGLQLSAEQLRVTGSGPGMNAGAGPVLFVCSGNSARSVMAEALLRSVTNGGIQVSSAGNRPQGVHPVALEVLRDRGVETAGLRSKGLDEVAEVAFETIITLCDVAREEQAVLPAHRELVHWSIADPAAAPGEPAQVRAAFERVADELTKRIRFLAPSA